MAEFNYTLTIKTDLPAEQVQWLVDSMKEAAERVVADAYLEITDGKLWFACDC